MRMAFLALRIFFGSCKLRRTTYPLPSSLANISAMRIGKPACSTSLPFGEEVVFWPGSEVGAICPPVIP